MTAPLAPPPPLAGEGREGPSGRTTGLQAEPKTPGWRVNSKMRARARSLRQHIVSHPAKLVIEIDGSRHFEDRHASRDAKREAFLAAKGYRVLRFSNLDVVTNRTELWGNRGGGGCGESPLPALPRKRGRGSKWRRQRLVPVNGPGSK